MIPWILNDKSSKHRYGRIKSKNEKIKKYKKNKITKESRRRNRR